MNKFKLWYCVVDNGDGSSTPRFFASTKEYGG
jgi:hypothetical protein